MSSAADPTAMLGISPFVLSFPSQTTVTLFLAFTIISIVLLLVILLSLALSTSLSRHPSLLVFLGALTVYLFGSILSLLENGARPMTDRPPIGLCLVQASILQAGAPYLTASIFGMTLWLWTQANGRTLPSAVTFLLLYVLPCAAGLGMTVAAIVLGLHDCNTLLVAGLYCYLASRTFNRVGSGASLAFSVMTMLFNAATVATIVLQHRRNKRLPFQQKLLEGPTLAMLLEVGGLGTFLFVASIGIALALAGKNVQALDWMMVVSGIFCFILFGSQSEMFALYRSGSAALWDRLRNGPNRRPVADAEEHALSTTTSQLHYSQSDSNLVGADGRKECEAYERELSDDGGGESPGWKMFGVSGKSRQPGVVIKHEMHVRVDVAEPEHDPTQTSHRFRDH